MNPEVLDIIATALQGHTPDGFGDTTFAAISVLEALAAAGFEVVEKRQ